MIKNLCVAAIRLLALYLGTYAGLLFLTNLVLTISMSSSSNSDQFFVQDFLLEGITFAIAVGLWVYAELIAERMTPDSESGETVNIDAQDFVLIGLCLLGAATLIDSIPNILSSLVVETFRPASLIEHHHSTIAGTEGLNDPSSPNLLESALQTAIGFGLLLCGFRLRSILRKFQTSRTSGHHED